MTPPPIYWLGGPRDDNISRRIKMRHLLASARVLVFRYFMAIYVTACRPLTHREHGDEKQPASIESIAREASLMKCVGGGGCEHRETGSGSLRNPHFVLLQDIFLSLHHLTIACIFVIDGFSRRD